MTQPSPTHAPTDQTPEHMHEPPVVAPLPSLVAPVPMRFKLSNGIDVVAVRRQVAPIVSMNLVLRTGADHDGTERAGLASLTAEMLDEGAGSRSALEIAEALERLGADLYLGAGRDGSQVTLQVPTQEFEMALAIAADIVLRPRLEADDWNRVAHDRLTALAQRRDQPGIVLDDVVLGEFEDEATGRGIENDIAQFGTHGRLRSGVDGKGDTVGQHR